MNRVMVMTGLVAASMMAAPAMATNFSLSSTDASSGTSWFTAPQIQNGGYSNGQPLPSNFDHILAFSLTTDSLINVNLWQSEFGITFDNVLLNGVSIASNFVPGIGSMPGFSIGSGYAEAGNITLQFVGTNIGNPHAFGGTLNISAATIPQNPGAVPEPATWAMMIGGLGLVGASMRRRATKVQFA